MSSTTHRFSGVARTLLVVGLGTLAIASTPALAQEQALPPAPATGGPDRPPEYPPMPRAPQPVHQESSTGQMPSAGAPGLLTGPVFPSGPDYEPGPPPPMGMPSAPEPGFAASGPGYVVPSAPPYYGPGPGYGMAPGYGPASGSEPTQTAPATYDINADGVIGDDEGAAFFEGLFGAMDRNGDGILNQAEFAAAAPQGIEVKEVFARFQGIDTDKNGAISKGEYLLDAQREFKGLDKDGDGKVSPWEFRAGL